MGLHEITPGANFPPQMYITDELESRPGKTPDYLQEKLAIQDLARRMTDHPEGMLPRLVDLAMELTGAVSAGLSLYEENPAPGIFRWRYLHGTLAPFEDATTPRNFSPCGVTLDRKTAVLCKHPEQFYNWISDANIIVPEVLLVPLYLGGDEPLGTLWIVSDTEGHFDSNDARVATELASFAGIALRMVKTEKNLQASLEEQETLAKEMNHRVKNLFAIADGMVRLSARGASSVDEMSKTLSGRFHALASAHGLVRRTFNTASDDTKVTDLAALVRAILQPHEHITPGGISRFTICGPDVAFGEHSLNGIALVFHELATNAAKYGALKSDKGTIQVDWTHEGDNLVFRWQEYGGPDVAEVPDMSGFGSKLLRDTITRQFGGSIDKHWHRGGLHATLTVPLSSVGG
jgi:two-component sensor histidine kinase